MTTGLTWRHVTFSDSDCLPRLEFQLRGADINLSDSYRLKREALNFAGTLTLEGPFVTNDNRSRSFLLKAVDPLFRKGGAGAVLPIKSPERSTNRRSVLDVGKVLSRR
jgi:hypothetical protein